MERLKADPNLNGDITTVPAEGSLLPERSLCSAARSAQLVLDQMAAESSARSSIGCGRRARRICRSRRPEEALVLASIVEKENGPHR